MKNALTLFALVAILMGCQDDTKQLLKKIDGRWKINSVTYKSQSSRDSTASSTAIFLNFDACSVSTNKGGPSNCSAAYTIGSQQYPFTYQAPNGSKALYISPINQMSDPAYKQIANQLSGSYEIISLSEDALIIRRPLQGSIPGFEFIQYSATK